MGKGGKEMMARGRSSLLASRLMSYEEEDARNH